jgi:uncharacterized protein
MADITVRRPRFEFPDELDDVFPGDDPVRETYLVAFSLTLPYLEPYLIRTSRAVLDRVTAPELADDVALFNRQEAQHFQNHRRANEMIKAQLDPAVVKRIQAIEDRLDADYHRFTDSKSARFNLVYSEGFEALICVWTMKQFEESAAGLRSSRFGPWQQLWSWHGAEEIEHRTVAYDLYQHLVGSWWYRVVGSLRCQWHFHRTIARIQRELLKSLGHRARPRVPVPMRESGRRYLRTFLPSHNPHELRPDALVDIVLAQYAPPAT